MISMLPINITAGVTLVGASLIAVTPLAPAPLGAQVRAVRLASNETVAFEMTGSTVQILTPEGVENADAVYVQPHFPGAIPQALGYPAQLYPFSIPSGGTFDYSVHKGLEIMNNALTTELAEGNNVVFYGTSQSATIQTLEMEKLMSLPADDQPSPAQLGFVDYGDPDLPDGGLLARYDYPALPSGLAPYDQPGNVTLPTLGIVAYGPTPADAPWPNYVYTGEYDGFADSPRYPLDLLADVNALLGTIYVHANGSYKPASFIDTAFVWQTSPGYDGDTTYYLVPVQNLPLLDPLRNVPVIGNPLADLLQPDLKVLINLGYGPDNVGYSEYPNVFTPATGLFPDVNPITVLNELVAGAKEGVQNFATDVSQITPSEITAALSKTVPTVTSLHLDPDNLISAVQTLLADNTNAFTSVTDVPFQMITPTANIAEGLLTTIPQDDVNLMLAGVGQLADGNLHGAFTDSTSTLDLDVGFGVVWGFFADFAHFQSALSPAMSDVHTAVTEDMAFIEGLPGLLSDPLP